MNRLLPLLAACALAATACAEEPASDAQLRKMCERLEELRGKREPTDVAGCVDEARREGVSGRQARCRISAANTTEYWVRCRTGEARERPRKRKAGE
jgi:hypothetical protein